MNSTRLQLLIIVSASQLFSLCQHASALTNHLPSNLISYSSIPTFITPSDSESKNTLSLEASSRSVDKTASSTSPNHSRQNNYTLAERGHEHRKGNTPLKSLLGDPMGLGILDDSSDDDDDGDGLFTGGWATYFTQNQIPGACGIVHQDSDVIVAMDYRRYGPLNKVSKYCGKKVRITSGDTTITATVADACPTCLNRNCLDLSEGAFKKLGVSVEEGMKLITWKFMD